MAKTLDDSIRVRAYHIWEASGCPSGRDEEFWHRAREMIAADDDQPKSPSQRRQRKPLQLAQQTRRRSRQPSPSDSSGVSAPPG